MDLFKARQSLIPVTFRACTIGSGKDKAFFRHFLVIFYWPESIWDALSALTRSQEGQQNGLFCPLFVE